MTSVYKSDEAERAVRERYLEILKHWPVPNRQLRVPTREGETFIIACGDESAPPLLLLHGSIANSAMWIGDVAAWSKHLRIYAVDMIGDAGLSAPSRPPLSSDAHALWLDDVLQALSLTRVSMAGVSLGGWLALDYAIRRPGRVENLVLVCPGGVGRVKVEVVLKLLPLQMLGSWGKRKASEVVLGRAPANPSPALQSFLQFFQLIQENFRPRRVKLPVFSDDALKSLNMPVLAIVGGKDVLIDSDGTKRRLERNVAGVQIRYIPEAGHFIPAQTAPILDFLCQHALR
ncbi:MAG TPA: alpha/beta hydrolase [Bryobacteraceae bacterium]|jgi:pimeloyl-ACP methyl ester carboxylesterase|nr:alpha/beta hydrolase [Bryobacteraceae bacterium]